MPGFYYPPGHRRPANRHIVGFALVCCALAKIALLLMGVAFLLFVVMRLAFGQGYVQHDWIQNNRSYVDRTGVHCCGIAHDCFPIAPGDLHEDNDGVAYKGQRLKYGERGIYWAAEPDPPAGIRPFVCVRHGKLVCAFRPQPGS